MTLNMVAYRVTFDYDDHEICLPGAVRRIADLIEQITTTGAKIYQLEVMDEETGVKFWIEPTYSPKPNKP